MKASHKRLALLMVLCMILPLFGVGAAAADTETPIDYVFEEVSEQEVPAYAEKLTFDPFSALQWDMKMIGMPRAWNSGLTGAGVVVGIVDSGLSHLTMDIDRGRILEGVNLSPIKINIGSPVLDTVGHGTFIAGIIGATRGNGVGIAGVAPGVTFAPVKCFSSLFTTPDAEVNGVYAAVDQFNCDVINLSSGAPEDIPALHDAVRYAISKGAIVISTVGNDGNDVLNYPGAYDEVIAVGSVDKNEQVSYFSQRNESVFVVAPGEDVYSLGTTPFRVYKSSGTSFSAPFVSGLAALLKEQYPQMTQDDFKQILIDSSKDLGAEGYDTEYGYGLLQVPEAIEAAAAYFGGTAPEMPEPQPARPSLLDRFKDVFENSWFYKAIRYVTERRYMVGVSDERFAPHSLVTRAQLAQILYNMEGRPAVDAGCVFSDVPDSAWFFSPVVWAERTGLVRGCPDGTFDPNGPVTREQAATILQRYAAWKGLASDVGDAAGRFADFGLVSGYARDAMQWAVRLGILKGDGAGLLNPQGTATRAEIAAMLQNFDLAVK